LFWKKIRQVLLQFSLVYQSTRIYFANIKILRKETNYEIINQSEKKAIQKIKIEKRRKPN